MQPVLALPGTAVGGSAACSLTRAAAMAEVDAFAKLLSYVEKETETLKLLRCKALKECLLTGQASSKREGNSKRFKHYKMYPALQSKMSAEQTDVITHVPAPHYMATSPGNLDRTSKRSAACACPCRPPCIACAAMPLHARAPQWLHLHRMSQRCLCMCRPVRPAFASYAQPWLVVVCRTLMRLCRVQSQLRLQECS